MDYEKIGRVITNYSVNSAGRINVTQTIEPDDNLPNLPRFGMVVELPIQFNNMTWFGRGPHESYWDRNPVQRSTFILVRSLISIILMLGHRKLETRPMYAGQLLQTILDQGS